MSYETAEKKVFNEALLKIEATNKELLRVYQKAQKEIEQSLLEFQKVKLSGQYVSSQEEFRLKALYQQIEREVDKIYFEAEILVRSGFQSNMELAYYKHAYNIERQINLGIIGADYALNFPVLPTQAIQSVLNTSIGGFTLSERWGEISANAKFRMRGVVAEALAKGDTIKNLAKELKGLDDWVDGYSARSITVARTEMLRAYSYGQDMARIEAEEAGVEFRYKWSSALDGRTRKDHVTMNGKFADIVKGQPVFTMPEPDGSKAAGPRMAGLSAKESVGCRCRRLDLPFGIEPTSRAVKLPDGTYETVDFNINAEAWIEKNYGKKI